VRVLVCGDRDWTDEAIIHAVLDGYARQCGTRNIVVIEGDARGADRIAGAWTTARRTTYGHDIDHECYPANWAEHHRAAGPIRNQQMLTEGDPDSVLAFHDNLAESKGTADMVRRARKANLPVYVIGHAT